MLWFTVGPTLLQHLEAGPDRRASATCSRGAVPGAVGHPPAVRRTPRLSRLRRSGGRRRADVRATRSRSCRQGCGRQRSQTHREEGRTAGRRRVHAPMCVDAPPRRTLRRRQPRGDLIVRPSPTSPSSAQDTRGHGLLDGRQATPFRRGATKRSSTPRRAWHRAEYVDRPRPPRLDVVNGRSSTATPRSLGSMASERESSSGPLRPLLLPESVRRKIARQVPSSSSTIDERDGSTTAWSLASRRTARDSDAARGDCGRRCRRTSVLAFSGAGGVPRGALPLALNRVKGMPFRGRSTPTGGARTAARSATSARWSARRAALRRPLRPLDPREDERGGGAGCELAASPRGRARGRGRRRHRPYQPVEGRFRFTRACIRCSARRGSPFSLSPAGRWSS